jgi:PKHD-type hydroxylase
MQSYYWIWKNCVSKNDVDSMKEVCLEAEKISGTTFKTKEASSSIRKSEIAWIHDNAIKQTLLDIGSIINYQAYQFDLYYNTQTFDVQFTEYDSSYNGKYDWHLDAGPNQKIVGDRKLSMILQMSEPDEYEGGQFEIQTGTSTEEDFMNLEKGTIIAFPSFMLHRITPVTKGKRHSLVTWLNGPSFR